MKKILSLACVFALFFITLSTKVSASAPIRVRNLVTSLAYFKNASITSPAINSATIDSQVLNPGESVTIKTQSFFGNNSYFPLPNPTNGWIYYQYTIIFTDDNNPTTPDQANFYELNPTYESIVQNAGSRTIASVDVSYSYASKITVNYINENDASQIVSSSVRYGRSAHHHTFNNASSIFDGDPIDIDTRSFLGYQFQRTARTFTHITMLDETYEVNHYYSPVSVNTITYVDGTPNASVFTNETHTVNQGDVTPHFTGSTTRPGYTFNGWSPSVSPTVTSDQTYTALWAQNTYTITYVDGTPDTSVFSSETHTVNQGDVTPKFNGSTIRPGYTFIGWSPSVSTTVTSDQTYTAMWAIIEDKDNSIELPKTGLNSSYQQSLTLIAIGLGIIFIRNHIRNNKISKRKATLR